jgi:hypothetical protein
MKKKLFIKIFLLTLFFISLSAFYYLNTTAKNISGTSSRKLSSVENTNKIKSDEKLNLKSDSLTKQNKATKNSTPYIQDVEIMKYIIQIGKESLPVLSLKDYIPFIK